MENILALDVGMKKIGLAVGSPETKFAFPRPALLVSSVAEGIAGIREVVEAEQITKIIAGLPTSTDGSDSEQTMFTRDFLRQLAEHIRLPMETVDERFSTQGVIKQQVGRNLHKGEEDSLVAQALLLTYLESL